MVLLSFTNGLPNGYWYNVRKYFVQGARYNITLNRGNTLQMIVPSNARILPFITSILGTWWGEQSLSITTYISGNSRIYNYTCNNATMELILVIER